MDAPGPDDGLPRRRKPLRRAPAPTLIVGWREVVALPGLGVPRITAKIDTGARTSALHATRIVRFTRDGADWVRFHIPHGGITHAQDCEAPVVDRREIRNTGGLPDLRIVIETWLAMGARRWQIEVSLADRGAMTAPLILGRTALRRHGIVVDAGRSWLAGHPGETTR